VAAMAAQGLRYIISTGGEGNVFTCATDQGMEAFVARYESPALLGFDFDIEATQTPYAIRDLAARIRVAQLRRPHLRWSFTLATLAASDGTGSGLNATGKTVLAALAAAGVEDFLVNLMVMDYGPAVASNCVVRAGRCDMAASARQAVMNLHQGFGVPLKRIEVTPMIGINDVTDNVFTQDDARAVGSMARELGLAGVHYWSLDRDKPCANAGRAVSPECSSLNDLPDLAFWHAFGQGLR